MALGRSSSSGLARYGVIDGNPRVRFAIRPHAAEARKRDVGRSDHVSALNCIVVGFFTGASSHFVVGVELNRYLGVVKLHGSNVYQIAPQHQLLAFAFHHIGAVPSSVAGRGDGLDAWHQVGGAIKARELARLYIRIQRRHSTLKKAF